MSSPSPFLRFVNSEIKFEVASGEYTLNSVGNKVAKTKVIEILAVLKLAADSSSVSRFSHHAQELQNLKGSDGQAFLLEGFLVKPQIYPPEIHFLMEGEAFIKNVLPEVDSGRFKLLPVIQSPYLLASGVNLTTPIKGILRIN
jgi:hypothetical protein